MTDKIVTTPDPLPCPFCGGPARTFRFNGTTQATCAAEFKDCAGTDAVAPVVMWNTRAAPEGWPSEEDIARVLMDLDHGHGCFDRWKREYPKHNLPLFYAQAAAVLALFANHSLQRSEVKSGG